MRHKKIGHKKIGSDRVLFVVDGEHGIAGCEIGDIRIEGRCAQGDNGCLAQVVSR